MANALPFGIFDEYGAPVTGAAAGCTVSAWNPRTLASRSAPAVVEVRPYVYEARFSDDDELVGTLALIDTGAGRSQRWVVLNSFQTVTQFFGCVLTNTAGDALWSGADPTLEWSRTPAPPVTKPTAGVFVVVPSYADILADASGRLVAATGAAPGSYSLGVDALPATPPAPAIVATTPAAIVAKVAECVSLISPKWAGAVTTWQAAKNLPFSEKAINRSEAFNIDVRDDSDTQSWGVSGSYVGQFRLVVRLGTPVHTYTFDRQQALLDDVKRIAHAVENYTGYPAGTQSLFYEPTSGTEKQATPEWWETELVFRVVFIGELEAPPTPP